MNKWNKYVICYLLCFLLVVLIDLLSRGEGMGARAYMVLMPLLALSIVLLGDFTPRGAARRAKKYRWSIIILLLGIGTSFFMKNTMFAGGLILITTLIAPVFRMRTPG
jgi:hypothetical protein